MSQLAKHLCLRNLSLSRVESARERKRKRERAKPRKSRCASPDKYSPYILVIASLSPVRIMTTLSWSRTRSAPFAISLTTYTYLMWFFFHVRPGESSLACLNLPLRDLSLSPAAPPRRHARTKKPRAVRMTSFHWATCPRTKAILRCRWSLLLPRNVLSGGHIYIRRFGFFRRFRMRDP